MLALSSPWKAAVQAILAFVLLLIAPSLAWAQTTIYEYNSNYDVIDRITVPGTVTSYTYDSGGGSQTGLVVDSESAGITTRYYYDTNNNLTQSYTEPSAVTSTTYDSLGNDVVTGDANGFVFQYKYDDSPYQPPIEPSGRITSTVYDTQGDLLVVGTEDVLGRTTETYYDASGNIVESFMPQGTVTSVTYDGSGNDLIVAADIAGQNTMTVYDSTGNVLQQIDTTGSVTSLAYDSQTNQVVAGFPAQSFFDVFFDISAPNGNLFQGSNPNLVVAAAGPTLPQGKAFISSPNIWVAVTPESSSLALIVPALLFLAGLAFRAARAGKSA